jgi:hypothetical protein
VHLHGRKLRENVRYVLEARPVVLQILARGEMAIAAVITAGDRSERAQLLRGEKSIGDRDAQHGRVALNIKSVTQPQMAEFVLRQLACEKTPRLIAKLRDTLLDQGLVDDIVAVHRATLIPRRRRG